MALFGVPHPRAGPRRPGGVAALDLLAGLERLNAELAAVGQAAAGGRHRHPHGPGAGRLHRGDGRRPGGRKRVRREYTAIGETVNLGQRRGAVDEACGGPVLVSEETRLRLRHAFRMTCLGERAIDGSPRRLVVHRVEGAGGAPKRPEAVSYPTAPPRFPCLDLSGGSHYNPEEL